MYINIIMTILTNRQKINIYLHPTDMLYKSSHKYTCILFPPQNMDIELHVCIFFTNYFQVIYMVIIKIFPSTFRCLFYIYLSRRADKHTLLMKPPRNLHQCKIFLYTQVIHYNIANQMDLLCNVEFVFPQSKNLSHWFQFTKTSKRIKKESFKCNPFQAQSEVHLYNTSLILWK